MGRWRRLELRRRYLRLNTGQDIVPISNAPFHRIPHYGVEVEPLDPVPVDPVEGLEVPVDPVLGVLGVVPPLLPPEVVVVPVPPLGVDVLVIGVSFLKIR
jgi:hypothetical protein